MPELFLHKCCSAVSEADLLTCLSVQEPEAAAQVQELPVPRQAEPQERAEIAGPEKDHQKTQPESLIRLLEVVPRKDKCRLFPSPLN